MVLKVQRSLVASSIPNFMNWSGLHIAATPSTPSTPLTPSTPSTWFLTSRDCIVLVSHSVDPFSDLL